VAVRGVRMNGVAQGELFGVLPVLPAGLQYALEFITAEEEAGLLERVAQLPLEEAKYKEYTARRRTTTFGSEYDFGANVLESAPAVPSFLLPLRARLAQWVEQPAERFAQALVSEYRPGTPLGWHRDVGQFELIAGVSLGTPCVMRFRPVDGKHAFELELQPRSAYVMRDAARWEWEHAIAPTPGLRYSVTFRTLRRKRR
jgi:alkylated DNA repair dioxygenase AlkB